MPRKGGGAFLSTASLERLNHAGYAVEASPTVGERANARSTYSFSGEHVLGTRGDDDLAVRSGLARCALKRLPRRVQIARTIVNDRDAHRMSS